MRRKPLLLIAALVVAAAMPAAARGIPVLPQQRFFHFFSEGLVSPKFHPRRDGNRVFFASSPKEARPWLAFTGLQIPSSFFDTEGLLAIFYRHSPGGIPDVSSIAIPANASTFDVKVTLYPTHGSGPEGTFAPQTRSLWDPVVHGLPQKPHWGLFILESIDKTNLSVLPKRIVVSEAVYAPPPTPPPSPPCVLPDGSPCPPPVLPQSR